MVCTCYPHFALITFSCYGIFHKLVLNLGGVFSDEFVDDPFLSENFIGRPTLSFGTFEFSTWIPLVN